MNIEAYLVNSFTDNGAGGNPAGVVLHADQLSNQDKLKIAQEVGFSETAFVSQDEDVDFNVSFFTTTDEVDFCGHATLAAFSTLYKQGLVSEGLYVQRTKAGLLNVVIEANGRITMSQKLPEFIATLSTEVISELIGIDSNVLQSTRLPIQVVSTGLPDIIVPVPNGYLDKIEVNESLLVEFSKMNNIVGIHAFELNEEGSELTASCRNFAPLFGIPEESATGSASGALASYLTKHLGHLGANHFTFEQGRAMGCSSRITASAKVNDKEIVEVLVGGFANEFGLKIIAL